MPTSERKSGREAVFVRSLISAGLGMGVTLLLFAGLAVLIYRNKLPGESGAFCQLLAVFAGSLTASLDYSRHVKTGLLTQTLVITFSFLLLVLLLSALRSAGTAAGERFPLVLLSAAAGSALGGLPRLDKKHKKRHGRRRRYNR